MSARTPGKRSRSRSIDTVSKPRGTFHPRVQAVGPEHFGIVTVDCAKARSKWLFADFYGNVLWPPTVVEHNRTAFDEAIAQLRQTMTTKDIRDVLVAVERTGRYHRPVQHAFAAAGFDTRVVHPFATAQFRLPADPGNKTDDTDRAARHRAAVQGFALDEQTRDEQWQILQLLERHRRDLVFKISKVCCQAREHLDAAFPGLAACFADIFGRDCAWHLITHFTDPTTLHSAGLAGLTRCLRDAGIGFQERTLHKVLVWAVQAALPDVAAAAHRRIALALYDDHQRKTQEIQALERELAGLLAHTPYLLLLAIPGINVVSAADFAGEMGSITHYANAKAITGRAGLCPSRYQSDKVDKANGPLRRRGNRRLRAAILQIADNLATLNNYFSDLSRRWKAQGKGAKDIRVRIGLRFCRIAYQMVAGRKAFHHPAARARHYVLQKLSAFHRDHDTDCATLMRDLQAAVEQLPRDQYRMEALPLQEELEKMQAGRGRGPQLLADLLPIVLARLGIGGLESTRSGEDRA